MKNLFINGSPNKKGNTAALAAAFFGSEEYETVCLPEFRINVYGQKLPGDQFGEILAKIRAADTVVIGSPVYWHNICCCPRQPARQDPVFPVPGSRTGTVDAGCREIHDEPVCPHVRLCLGRDGRDEA